MHVCMHICMYACMYAQSMLHVYICMYVCMFAYVHVCMNVCMNVYIVRCLLFYSRSATNVDHSVPCRQELALLRSALLHHLTVASKRQCGSVRRAVTAPEGKLGPIGAVGPHTSTVDASTNHYAIITRPSITGVLWSTFPCSVLPTL